MPAPTIPDTALIHNVDPTRDASHTGTLAAVRAATPGQHGVRSAH